VLVCVIENQWGKKESVRVHKIDRVAVIALPILYIAALAGSIVFF